MKKKQKKTLVEKYPPSRSCSCAICVGYCKRPGWWTVDEAARALLAGYASRMMLEMSIDKSFGVLSPAFKGCEQAFATDLGAQNGCNFLVNNRCELFGTGYEPLECTYCHHDRRGMGLQCHVDIGEDWNTEKGRGLVVQWCSMTDFWNKIKLRRQHSPLQR